MKQRVIDFIKYNPAIFKAYNFLGSLLLRIFGLFIPIDNKKILFVSFGGKKYDDSPQSLYEKMIEMEEFNDYKFVWAFVNTDINIPGDARKVKIDTLEYFVQALSSKFWIINVSAERGLNFKKNKTICINTWHGTPIKKIYGEENENVGKKRARKPEKFDLICAQSSYDQEIFSRIFDAPKENVIISDLPRNDVLLKYTAEDIKKIKMDLHIPADKKVILYMPTYREYTRDSANACYFNPPMDLAKWEKELGDEYVLLFRAHYLVVKNMNIKENAFVREMSKYKQLSELYAISDIMISDYSSAFFDFGILERPEVCFAYDLEEYEKHRGFYMDLNELPCKTDRTEDDVINHIKNMNFEEESKKVKCFKKKYTPQAGHATEIVLKEMITRYM